MRRDMYNTLPESGSPRWAESFEFMDTPKRRGPLLREFVDSFKRDPEARATPKGVVGADGKVFDVEAAIRATTHTRLNKQLKGRHLQMIAIGGSIGIDSTALGISVRDADIL